MPEIDHLVFAADDLGSAVADAAARFGVEPVVGGSHDGFGTRNHLLGIDDTTYYEIIGVDHDQPEPRGPRPFGIDSMAGRRLVTFAVHPGKGERLEDVGAMMSADGIDVGPIASMSRRTPSGEELRWSQLRGAGTGFAGGGVVPFVIDWGHGPGPAPTLPSLGGLVELELRHPNPQVRAMIERWGIPKIVVVDGVEGLTARFFTQRGEVVID